MNVGRRRRRRKVYSKLTWRRRKVYSKLTQWKEEFVRILIDTVEGPRAPGVMRIEREFWDFACVA